MINFFKATSKSLLLFLFFVVSSLLLVCLVADAEKAWDIAVMKTSPQVQVVEDFWYKFPVTDVVRVYDGDTFWVDFDMGFNIRKVNEGVRLLGCDTYELRTEKGPAAKAFTQDFLSTGTFILWTHGERDNFGRVLATIEKDGVMLDDVLTSAGLTTGRFRDR
jgi:endonuclease YncB( thermonuclease family)